jgi:hypothetical protein
MDELFQIGTYFPIQEKLHAGHIMIEDSARWS